MPRRHGTSIAALLALSLLAGNGRAEMSREAREARAHALLVDAVKLAAKGRCPTALDLLAYAAQLADDPDIAYQRANCELQLGRYTRTRKFAAISLQGGGPKGFVTHRSGQRVSAKMAARQMIEDVDDLVSTLRLYVTPTGACVRIDGRPLEVDPERPSVRLAGTADYDAPCAFADVGAPILVDPGLHTISISASRRISQTFEITVSTVERRSLRIALEQDPFRIMGTHILIVGGGALVAGGLLGAAALDRQRKSEGQCFASRCTQAGLDLNQRAQQLGNGASGALAVGGVLAGVGATFLFISATSPRPVRATVAVAPTPAGAFVGAQASF